MKKIQVITCLLGAVLAAAAFTGCGDTTVKTADASPQQGQDQPKPEKEQGSMAKVVSLEGDVVIMTGMGENAAKMDLSELAPNDVVRFTTITDDSGNDVIDMIVVMEQP